MAKELGYFDINKMLEGSDPRLVYEWQAFYELELFSEDRADLRNAINCLAIMDAAGAKPRGGSKFKVTDFMPNLDKEPKKDPTVLNPHEAKNILRSMYGNNSKSGSKPNS